MRHLKLIPSDTKIPFIKFRHVAVSISVLLIIASAALTMMRGLNFGIDFEGGILLEVATDGPADIAGLRTKLGSLGLGEVQIQEFGEANDVLIRVQTPDEGGDAASQAVIDKIKGALGEGVDYRRVEVVGPQVSGELIQSGVTAVILAIILMLIYIWFRFEWQFSLGSVLALVHDVALTIGVFSFLQLDFSLQTIAAILTIIGYSMNDTVVVYDRIRENLRKYKRMDLGELVDQSINETLSRTVMTSGTTLLALFSLYIFGGEVLRDFTFAMIFGILVGTYSSIFIASPLLLYIGVKRDWSGTGDAKVQQAKG